jgi:hypothetical protein
MYQGQNSENKDSRYAENNSMGSGIINNLAGHPMTPIVKPMPSSDQKSNCFSERNNDQNYP